MHCNGVFRLWGGSRNFFLVVSGPWTVFGLPKLLTMKGLINLQLPGTELLLNPSGF